MATLAEITNENFASICRCCIINRGEIDIFEAHIEGLAVASAIFICTNEEISKTDGLSKVICNICLQLLLKSFTFISTFKKSQKTIKSMYDEFRNKSEKTVSAVDEIDKNIKLSQERTHTTLRIEVKNETNLEDGEHVSDVILTDIEKCAQKFTKSKDYNVDERFVDNSSESLDEVGEDTSSIEQYEPVLEEKIGRKPNKRIEVDPNYRSGLDLQCFQCLSVFTSKADMVRHHKATGHSMAPNYKCGICSKAISKRKAYWDHMAMHRHLKTKAVCEICGAVVISLHLKRHMLVHQEKSHACNYCGKCYVQKNTLTDHIKRKHEGIERDLNTLCFICGTLCPDLKALTTHLNTHTDDKLKGLSHQCLDCGKYFLNAQSLSTHVYMAHKIKERIPKQHRKSKTVRQNSRRINTEKKENTGKTRGLRSETDKSHEEKSNTKREPQECPICSKMICYLGYRRHLTTHTGIKPHQCKHCSKSFRLYSSLKSHMYVHLNLKPFKCDICEQQFRHYTTLKVHKRVHTGEKPYSCSLCGKGFRSASGLKRHQNQRQHHQTKEKISTLVRNVEFRS